MATRIFDHKRIERNVTLLAVLAMHPYYIIRALGGILYLAGALIMAFNLWKTIRSGVPAKAPVPVALAAEAAE